MTRSVNVVPILSANMRLCLERLAKAKGPRFAHWPEAKTHYALFRLRLVKWVCPVVEHGWSAGCDAHVTGTCGWVLTDAGRSVLASLPTREPAPLPREFHRILLSELPDWEARGWRPAVELACGAVGADPWCGGTLATITVTRDSCEVCGDQSTSGSSPCSGECALLAAGQPVHGFVYLGDDRKPKGVE